MKQPIPKIVAACYMPDPNFGGFIAALKQNDVEAIVLMGTQWPRSWIPEWPPDPDRATYYVVAQWSREAMVVAHRNPEVMKLVAEKRIILLPPRRFLMLGWYA